LNKRERAKRRNKRKKNYLNFLTTLFLRRSLSLSPFLS